MDDQNRWINDDTSPVIIANALGFIVSVNVIFEKQFLWPAADLVGQPLSVIIPPNLRDAHNMGFSRYRISKNSSILNTPLDLEILRGDGKTQIAQHYIALFERDGEQLFAARITPR